MCTFKSDLEIYWNVKLLILLFSLHIFYKTTYVLKFGPHKSKLFILQFRYELHFHFLLWNYHLWRHMHISVRQHVRRWLIIKISISYFWGLIMCSHVVFSSYSETLKLMAAAVSAHVTSFCHMPHSKFKFVLFYNVKKTQSLQQLRWN